MMEGDSVRNRHFGEQGAYLLANACAACRLPVHDNSMQHNECYYHWLLNQQVFECAACTRRALRGELCYTPCCRTPVCQRCVGGEAARKACRFCARRMIRSGWKAWYHYG